MDCVSLAAVVVALLPINFERIGENTLLTVGDHRAPAADLLYRRLDDGAISLDAAHSEQKRAGHNTRLFQEMLRREPDAREIESTLMRDNLAEYERARKEDPDAPCAALVMHTPAMRVRARFGFTRIVECTRMAHSIVLRVALP